jgi:cullin 3
VRGCYRQNHEVSGPQAYAHDVELIVSRQRKELSHQLLISETITQLTHFKPEVSMIKQRIENLIEREYLERTDDGSKYRYLA